LRNLRRLQMNRIAEDIERLARFMGWEHDGIGMYNADPYFDCYPLDNWNDCMLVEARLREKGLWDDYVLVLMKELGGVRYLEDGRPEIFCTSGNLMAATKEQRMQAALAVIERKADE
jgi:hypothetical protein